jgi:hypothetical protein
MDGQFRTLMKKTLGMKATLGRMLTETRRKRRRDPRRRATPPRHKLFRLPGRAPPIAAPPAGFTESEAVAMIRLAIDRVGPASVRAVWLGTPVRVPVPDERVAAVFRSALDQSRRQRPTDRLVEITTDP